MCASILRGLPDRDGRQIALAECGIPAVLDGGPIGGNLRRHKRLTSPYLLKWEKSNVDNDEQQLLVHRKQGLWPGLITGQGSAFRGYREGIPRCQCNPE